MRNAYDRIYNNRRIDDVETIVFPDTLNDQQSSLLYSQMEQRDDYDNSKLNDIKQDDVPKTPEIQAQVRRNPAEQIVSLPLILSPPKVEAQQIKQSVKQNKSSYSAEAKSKDSANKLSKSALDSKHADRSQIRTPFKPLLEWPPSLQSEFSSEQNGLNPRKNPSLNNDEDFNFDLDSVSLTNEEFTKDTESSSNEHSSFIQKDSLSLMDEFTAMLNDDDDDLAAELKQESSYIGDESSGFQDEAFTLLAESSSEIEEISFINEESNTLDDIPAMLEESPTVLEEPEILEEFSENIDVQEIDSVEDESIDFPYLHGEFSAMLETAYTLLDKSYNEDEKLTIKDALIPLIGESSTFQNEFSTLLDELNDHSSDSESSSEKNEIPDEGHSAKLNKISNLLEGFSAMLENFSAEQEDESESKKESSSNEDTLILDLVESSSEKKTPEESSESNDFEKENSQFNKPEEESFHQIKDEDHSLKKPKPIVKLPVLVANLNIDIEIFDSYPLHLPVGNITKLEWSNQFLDSRVVLPSDTVFFKGVLIADIEYVKDDTKNTIHTVKLPIPWSKSASIGWLYPPMLPEAHSHKEFMFASNQEECISSHFEHTQQFSEQIESQLRNINFVWHEELNRENKQKLDIQGRAILSIDLLQEQFIKLNSIY